MRFPWQGRDRDAELDEEIQSHLRMAQDDLVARGLTETDAAYAARRELGNAALVKEITREMWRGVWLEQLGRELRYIVRGLVRRPSVTVVVVVTLALGIGANAAVFSVVDQLFLRTPAGVRDPAMVHRIYVGARTATVQMRSTFDPVEARDVLAAAPDSAAIAAYRGGSIVYEPTGGARRVSTATFVTSRFFDAVGVRPAFGRFFAEDESRFGSPVPVVVLSYEFWRRELRADSSALGSTLSLDGHQVTVIGVAQRGFTGIDLDPADMWLPLASYTGFDTGRVPWYDTRGMRALGLIVRVRPGATAELVSARAEQAVRRGLVEMQRRDTTARAVLGSIISHRGPQSLSQDERTSILLAGVAALVLILACANAGNLLLAQALHRRREMAVRLALGIGRARLCGQIVLESVVLALLSGAAAILSAGWLGHMLRVMLLPDAQWTASAFHPRIAAFTMTVTLFAGVIVGAVPAAAEVWRAEIAATLKAGTRDGSKQSSRIRATLLVVQAALSLVLLVGAGLFLRSFQRVRDIELGYDVDRVIVAASSPRDTVSMRDVAARLRAIPGIEGSALTAVAPLDAMLGAKLFWQNGDTLPVPAYETGYMAVEPSYLSTVGQRVVRGRDLSVDDDASAAPVMVVDQTMARSFWPDGDPIGTCLRFGTPTARCYTVVGVTRDAHRFHVVEQPGSELYVTLAQAPERLSVTGLVVRVTGDPAPTVRWLRQALHDTAAVRRTHAAATMIDVFAPQYRPWRLGAQLLVALGVLSLVIAALGLYAVVAYMVARRTRELAVRVALGARSADVMRLVFGEGLRLVGIGIAVGSIAALGAGRLISTLLYDTSPREPVVFAGASAVLLGTAMLAVLIPVRRAVRVDPVVVLRDE